MVMAGEQSGALPEAFQQLHDYLEWYDRLMKDIQQGAKAFAAGCESNAVQQVEQEINGWAAKQKTIIRDELVSRFGDQSKKSFAFFVSRYTEGEEQNDAEFLAAVNKQMKIDPPFKQYNELRRVTPCPHGWEIGGAQAFAVSQCFVAGDPRCTAWFESLLKVAEDRVERGVGAIDRPDWEEKIRLFWFDIMPYGWVFEFMPWLEETFGAVVVMDMFGNFPYTMIDTTNTETMFRDLSKRSKPLLISSIRN